MAYGDTIELYCSVVAETEQALRCDFGDKEVWIPKSQIDDDSEVYENGHEGEILVTEWIAMAKGLI